jgi:GT2 family glycosyltransferase
MLEKSSDNSGRGASEILAVIVLYNVKPRNSSALKSLMTALDNLEQPCPNIQVLVFDNTPGGQEPGALPDNVRYIAARNNAGLAAAYNQALTIADQEGLAWLLTLDQDTSLPPNYIVKMQKAALRWQDELYVAAIVPQLVGGSCLLSPNYVRLLRNSPVPQGFRGLNVGELFALNSAALLRVDALREIGGFCEDFWLDQLDAVLYHQLHRAGKRIYVAGDVQVQHQLSLQDYRSLSPDRFRNFLQTESAFFDIYKGVFENQILTSKLLFRYLKHKTKGTNGAIVREIVQVLKLRVFHSKSSRISQWRRSILRRAIVNGADKGDTKQAAVRPRISVCMAAYNGERYIIDQLGSIIRQLAPTDEIIIVDDASIDLTYERIIALTDPRIRIFRSEINRGVLRTFEEAISRSTGEIIFLSDQDDLWEPNKVEIVIKAFIDHREVNLVASDAFVIDENGARLFGSYFSQRGGFSDGFFSNLLRSKYHGCIMSFRASLLSEIFPFPIGFDVLHDIWIGMRNRISGGKTLYIDKPLVQYRRHSDNVTGVRRLGLLRQLRVRVDLIRALIYFSLRGKEETVSRRHSR